MPHSTQFVAKSTNSPLHTLELTLWHPATRTNRALMDATFAPDFHEFD